MAKLQIVIEIPEEEYENIKSMYIHNNATAADLRRIILNGTPLPEHHGRLIDADDIDKHIVGSVDTRDCPTIIEAE